MTHGPHWGGTIRKLWASESDKLRDHLLRLDTTNRRMRFAHAVSDRFLIDYAECQPDMGSVMHAYMEDGQVRAVAELRRLGRDWAPEAEAAFSVEPAWQNRGIGNKLMGRVVRSARNRGVRHLLMNCLAENRKIQAIARKRGEEVTVLCTGRSGGSQLSVWRQIIVDAMDRGLELVDVEEPGCLGAALLAGVGTGHCNDLESAIQRTVRVTTCSSPDPAIAALYRDRRHSFNSHSGWRRRFCALIQFESPGGTLAC